MKSKYLLLLGLASVAMSSGAQQLTNDYIQTPESSDFPQWVNKWTPGTPLFEDENFFISRVKLRPQFRNTATQVYHDFNESNDKQVCFWVPIGDTSRQGVNTNALPNGIFDSEVFSMWPYVTVYGNWTSPHGWVPGGFADAAHKHGVMVSGVASIPWGSITDSWKNCLAAQVKIDANKIAQFLYYHGVNGLGYNSEFSGGGSYISGLQNQHETIVKYFAERGQRAQNLWYDGVTNSGALSFPEQLLVGTNDQNFGHEGHERASLFVNYNWNTAARIAATTKACEDIGRSMLDLYAGHNMQGAGAGAYSATTFLDLANCNYSIGLWGAHSNNMIWQDRNKNGGSPIALQTTYQQSIEQFFTDGQRNPIAKMEVTRVGSFRPSDDWFGISRFRSAGSSLCWDLNEEPFITYFNLGNGRFFNWKGERQNDNEWYNLGVQDYMPTWRFWFADKFLGTEPSNMVENGLEANFSWDEAWMGGSSLNIKGSVADEYLHLFKTQFALMRNDVITVRYKLAAGTADISLALSVEGDETTIIRESSFKVAESADESDDVWVEKQFKVTGPVVSSFQGKNLAMIALHFANAKNIDLYLGEISITRSATPTPVAPQVTLSKVLANNSYGVDGKIIFNMPNNKPVDEPVYNLDVNTSLFRVYAQQENEEAVNMGMTSSWAALVFSAPVNREGSNRIRFGVAAVSTDYNSQSEITWGEWQAMGDYVTNDKIEISKSIIKPGEPFSIGYVDPLHPVADWKIYDGTNVIASASSTTGIDVEGIDKIGGYDLVVNEGKADEIRMNYYVQVSAWENGALPEIQSLTVNGSTDESGVTIQPLEELELGYTGREADGQGSRGIALNEELLGVCVGDLMANSANPNGLNAYKSFSIAGWVRVGDLSNGIYSLLTIENRAGTWPKNNWGYFWNRINQDGYIDSHLIDSAFGGSMDSDADGIRLYSDYSDTRLTPGAWCHVVWVFDYNEQNAVSYALYVNGKKQVAKTWMRINKMTREGKVANGDWSDFSDTSAATMSGHNETETGYSASSYPISTTDWISFGGTALNINAMSATVDDLQIWDKAMTAEDVATSMAGFSENNIPEGVLAWWDFNTDPGDDYGFLSKGKRAGVKAYRFGHIAASGEGEARQTPIIPNYSAGCPFLSADTYKVTTLPTWTVKRGNLISAEGSATEGKAVVNYKKEGDFTATLTLENAHGSHSKDYPVITVSNEGTNSIEGIAATENVEVYAADGSVFVSFAEAGSYTVNVYNASGVLVNGRTLSVESGSAAHIALANAGVYVVNIAREGQQLRNVKVVVR